MGLWKEENRRAGTSSNFPMLSDRPSDKLSNVVQGKHRGVINIQTVYIFTLSDLMKSTSKAYSLYKFRNLRVQYGPVWSVCLINDPIL